MKFVKVTLSEEEGLKLANKFHFVNEMLDEPVIPGVESKEIESGALHIFTSPGGRVDDGMPERYSIIYNGKEIKYGLFKVTNFETKTNIHSLTYNIVDVYIPESMTDEQQWIKTLIKEAIIFSGYVRQNPEVTYIFNDDYKPTIVDSK